MSPEGQAPTAVAIAEAVAAFIAARSVLGLSMAVEGGLLTGCRGKLIRRRFAGVRRLERIARFGRVLRNIIQVSPNRDLAAVGVVSNGPSL